jgi:hypothetical protein
MKERWEKSIRFLFRFGINHSIPITENWFYSKFKFKTNFFEKTKDPRVAKQKRFFDNVGETNFLKYEIWTIMIHV